MEDVQTLLNNCGINNPFEIDEIIDNKINASETQEEVNIYEKCRDRIKTFMYNVDNWNISDLYHLFDLEESKKITIQDFEKAVEYYLNIDGPEDVKQFITEAVNKLKSYMETKNLLMFPDVNIVTKSSKLICIDSKERKNKNENANDFLFELHESVNNVYQMNLLECNIPLTWDVFSSEKKNNYIKIKSTSNDNETDIKIEGNYSAESLIAELNHKIKFINFNSLILIWENSDITTNLEVQFMVGIKDKNDDGLSSLFDIFSFNNDDININDFVNKINKSFSNIASDENNNYTSKMPYVSYDNINMLFTIHLDTKFEEENLQVYINDNVQNMMNGFDYESFSTANNLLYKLIIPPLMVEITEKHKNIFEYNNHSRKVTINKNNLNNLIIFYDDTFETTKDNCLGYFLGFVNNSNMNDDEITSETIIDQSKNNIVDTFGTKYINLVINDMNSTQLYSNIITGVTTDKSKPEIPDFLRGYDLDTIYDNCNDIESYNRQNSHLKPLSKKEVEIAKLLNDEINERRTLTLPVLNNFSYFFARILLTQSPASQSAINNSSYSIATLNPGTTLSFKRTYIGPTNISKLRIQVYDDRNQLLSLNQDFQLTLKVSYENIRPNIVPVNSILS